MSTDHHRARRDDSSRSYRQSMGQDRVVKPEHLLFLWVTTFSGTEASIQGDARYPEVGWPGGGLGDQHFWSRRSPEVLGDEGKTEQDLGYLLRSHPREEGVSRSHNHM